MSLDKAIAALAPHYERVTVKHQQQGEKSVTTIEFTGNTPEPSQAQVEKAAAELFRKRMDEAKKAFEKNLLSMRWWYAKPSGTHERDDGPLKV